jgi:hypothetical protein
MRCARLAAPVALALVALHAGCDIRCDSASGASTSMAEGGGIARFAVLTRNPTSASITLLDGTGVPLRFPIDETVAMTEIWLDDRLRWDSQLAPTGIGLTPDLPRGAIDTGSLTVFVQGSSRIVASIPFDGMPIVEIPTAPSLAGDDTVSGGLLRDAVRIGPDVFVARDPGSSVSGPFGDDLLAIQLTGLSAVIESISLRGTGLTGTLRPRSLVTLFLGQRVLVGLDREGMVPGTIAIVDPIARAVIGAFEIPELAGCGEIVAGREITTAERQTVPLAVLCRGDGEDPLSTSGIVQIEASRAAGDERSVATLTIVDTWRPSDLESAPSRDLVALPGSAVAYVTQTDLEQRLHVLDLDGSRTPEQVWSEPATGVGDESVAIGSFAFDPASSMLVFPVGTRGIVRRRIATTSCVRSGCDPAVDLDVYACPGGDDDAPCTSDDLALEDPLALCNAVPTRAVRRVATSPIEPL